MLPKIVLAVAFYSCNVFSQDQDQVHLIVAIPGQVRARIRLSLQNYCVSQLSFCIQLGIIRPVKIIEQGHKSHNCKTKTDF